MSRKKAKPKQLRDFERKQLEISIQPNYEVLDRAHTQAQELSKKNQKLLQDAMNERYKALGIESSFSYRKIKNLPAKLQDIVISDYAMIVDVILEKLKNGEVVIDLSEFKNIKEKISLIEQGYFDASIETVKDDISTHVCILEEEHSETSHKSKTDSDLDKMHAYIENLEDESQELSDKNSGLEEEIQRFKKANNTLKDKNDNYVKENESLKKELSDQEKNHQLALHEKDKQCSDTLHENRIKYKQRMQNLQDNHNKAITNLNDNHKKEVNRLKEEIQRLNGVIEKQKNSHEKQLQDLDNKFKSSAKYRELRGEIETLLKENASLRAANNASASSTAEGVALFANFLNIFDGLAKTNAKPQDLSGILNALMDVKSICTNIHRDLQQHKSSSSGNQLGILRILNTIKVEDSHTTAIDKAPEKAKKESEREIAVKKVIEKVACSEEDLATLKNIRILILTRSSNSFTKTLRHIFNGKSDWISIDSYDGNRIGLDLENDSFDYIFIGRTRSHTDFDFRHRLIGDPRVIDQVTTGKSSYDFIISEILRREKFAQDKEEEK